MIKLAKINPWLCTLALAVGPGSWTEAHGESPARRAARELVEAVMGDADDIAERAEEASEIAADAAAASGTLKKELPKAAADLTGEAVATSLTECKKTDDDSQCESGDAKNLPATTGAKSARTLPKASGGRSVVKVKMHTSAR